MPDVMLLKGDCLALMPTLAAGSVDMVLCDLPYGTTACKWDAVISFEPLWVEYRRAVKRSGAIVLTASQPFTTALIASNMKEFRYCWVWDKVNKNTGALNANRMPMKRHEDIAVFYRSQPAYIKQWQDRPPRTGGLQGGHGAHTKYGKIPEKRVASTAGTGRTNPCSVISIPAMGGDVCGLHPAQKPVALLEYLIRTYTQPGDTVLDNTMGSGSTGVACAKTGRSFIGIERDEGYFAIAERRIAEAQAKATQIAQPLLFAAE